MPPETDFKFEFTPESTKYLGVVFNPKRKEYSNFKEFFQSNDIQEVLSSWFDEMFENGGWGAWTIKPSWASRKASLGYSTKANIMTGRMKSGFVRRKGASLSMGFPADVALRKYAPQQMTWGVNLNAKGFQTGSEPYPKYALDKNELIEFSSFFMSELGRIFGDYLINLFSKKKIRGL